VRGGGKAGDNFNGLPITYIKREGKKILPTEKGAAIIKILPEKVKSPVLTAEWENRLKLVERGEIPHEEFMAGIVKFVQDVVLENQEPVNVKEYRKTWGNTSKKSIQAETEAQTQATEIIGSCPRCKANNSQVDSKIIISPFTSKKDGKKYNRYACQARDCSFVSLGK